MGGLEIRADLAEQALEGILAGLAGVVPAGRALGTGHEVVRQGFVAVDVEGEIDAGLLHLLDRPVDLRRGLGRRLGPLAVEVAPERVAAQVTTHRAVDAHIGHHVDHGLLEQSLRDRILGIEQAIDKALDPPLGHGLAGVLTGGHPDLLAPGRLLIADDQQGVGVAVGRGAQVLGAHAVKAQGIGDELLMALQRVRREIRVIDHAGVGPVTDDQLAAVEFGLDPVPVLAVDRGHGAVVAKAVGEGHLAGILDGHHAVLPVAIAELKVEPLQVLITHIVADLEADVVGGRGAHHLDVAAIETAVNAQAHDRLSCS